MQQGLRLSRKCHEAAARSFGTCGWLALIYASMQPCLALLPGDSRVAVRLAGIVLLLNQSSCDGSRSALLIRSEHILFSNRS